MSFFKRLFGIASAESHAVLDKIEDPVKMTEQGLRQLREDLNESLKGLAEVKAIAIRTRRDAETSRATALDYEQKAMLLLKKAQEGAITPQEADRLAVEALNKKETAVQLAMTNEKNLVTHEAAVAKMEVNVNRLKQQISNWENEAKTLKARARVSEATQKLNKHLANVDSSSTVAMLEKMKDKINQQEALAESYGQMADANTSVDEEINKALGPSTVSSSAALEALKAKLQLPPAQ
jgi:phage shock protein A